MAKMKKGLAVILSIVMALTLLVSCGSKDGATLEINGKTETFPYVMECGGNQISLDEYLYNFSYYRYLMDYGDSSVWESEENAAYLTEVLNNIFMQKFAILELADEMGIALTEEEEAELLTNLETMKANYENEEAFLADMADAHLTEEVLLDYWRTVVLQEKIYNSLYGPEGEFGEPLEDVLTRVNEEYVHVKHILIPFTEEDAEGLAQEVYQKAIGGEDFDALREEYDADVLGQPAEGYTFTYGEMVEPFEEAAFSMAEGDISEPVETSYGYHIILKLPIDEQYIIDNYTTFSDRNDEFFVLLEEKIATLDVKYASNYDLLTPANILAALGE